MKDATAQASAPALLYQGMTSVMPKERPQKSGFSPCAPSFPSPPPGRTPLSCAAPTAIGAAQQHDGESPGLQAGGICAPNKNRALAPAQTAAKPMFPRSASANQSRFCIRP